MKINLIGMTFHRLMVTSEAGRSRSGKTLWNCSCSCGGFAIATTSDLRSGHTMSCGCIHRERATAANIQHGMTGTPEHAAWKKILSRTSSSVDKDYPLYGGRGIRVRYQSFEDFYSDLGPRPTPKHSVDRINVDGHYEPGNCRWATKKEQGENRRTSKFISHDGLTLTMTEWSRRLGGCQLLVAKRLERGWEPSRAVSQAPLQTNTRRQRAERKMVRQAT